MANSCLVNQLVAVFLTTVLSNPACLNNSVKSDTVKPAPLTQDIVKMDSKMITSDANTFTYRGMAILEAFQSEYLELKKDGVVGENNRGLLSNMLMQTGIDISRDIRDKYKTNSGDWETLKETIRQVNMAREMLLEGYIIQQKRANPEFNPDKNKLMKLQRDKYQSCLQTGDYLQNENGAWVRKD